jgi:hypothetical protein
MPEVSRDVTHPAAPELFHRPDLGVRADYRDGLSMRRQGLVDQNGGTRTDRKCLAPRFRDSGKAP